MAAAMVNAIPTANTNLAGFGFGAMFPSWLVFRSMGGRAHQRACYSFDESGD